MTESDCSICFTEITEVTGRAVLGCKHAFHIKCLVTWLQTGGACPCCRAEPGDLARLKEKEVASVYDYPFLEDAYNVTPLMEAARSGDVGEIRRLVAEGADINAQDSQDDTALGYAALNGRDAAAEELLSLGANVETLAAFVLYSGATTDHSALELAIFGAAFLCSLPCMSACLELGVSPNVMRLDSGSTPLIEVIRSKEPAMIPIVRLLLEQGADVNAKDSAGFTAFDWSAYVPTLYQELVDLMTGHEAAATLTQMATQQT